MNLHDLGSAESDPRTSFASFYNRYFSGDIDWSSDTFRVGLLYNNDPVSAAELYNVQRALRDDYEKVAPV